MSNQFAQLSTLPSQISFNTLPTIGVARREVFDVRAQLMAEDNNDDDSESMIAGLEKGDLKPNFYEGGFKTWECALDLAGYVYDSPLVDGLHVTEVSNQFTVCLVAC